MSFSWRLSADMVAIVAEEEKEIEEVWCKHLGETRARTVQNSNPNEVQHFAQ